MSLPCRSARRAAQKKCVPWQNDTWPKGDPRRPLSQWPWISARGVAPTCVRLAPLKPKSIVTTAPFGSLGSTGAAAGRVPLVITSGSYTDSFPVAGSRIVACTKAPRFAAFAMVQPEAAGDAPSGPVSRYGVASPAAVSGCAGTMISQFAFAAGAGAVAVADGQGVGDADGPALMAQVMPAPMRRAGADEAGAVEQAQMRPGSDEAGSDAGAAGSDQAGAGDAGADAPGDPAGPVAATGVAGVAEPAGAGVAQVAARPAASFEALSAVLRRQWMRITRPTASATARTPAISPGRDRGCLPRLG